MKKLLFVLLGIGCLVGGWALPAMAATGASTAVAFHYGANPPWDELQAFDLVVVDPDHVKDPGAPALPNTRLAAYVSVGEVHPSRAYAAQIPADWLRGDNRDKAGQQGRSTSLQHAFHSTESPIGDVAFMVAPSRRALTRRCEASV